MARHGGQQFFQRRLRERATEERRRLGLLYATAGLTRERWLPYRSPWLLWTKQQYGMPMVQRRLPRHISCVDIKSRNKSKKQFNILQPFHTHGNSIYYDSQHRWTGSRLTPTPHVNQPHFGQPTHFELLHQPRSATSRLTPAPRVKNPHFERRTLV